MAGAVLRTAQLPVSFSPNGRHILSNINIPPPQTPAAIKQLASGSQTWLLQLSLHWSLCYHALSGQSDFFLSKPSTGREALWEIPPIVCFYLLALSYQQNLYKFDPTLLPYFLLLFFSPCPVYFPLARTPFPFCFQQSKLILLERVGASSTADQSLLEVCELFGLWKRTHELFLPFLLPVFDFSCRDFLISYLEMLNPNLILLLIQTHSLAFSSICVYKFH